MGLTFCVPVSCPHCGRIFGTLSEVTKKNAIRPCLLNKLRTQNKDRLTNGDKQEQNRRPVRILGEVILLWTVQPLQHRATSKQSLCLPLFIQKIPALSIVLRHSLVPVCITFVLCNKQSPAPARKIFKWNYTQILTGTAKHSLSHKKSLFALCARATQHRHRGCFVSLNSDVLC